MNLHDWIDELCDALDIETEFDEALVLDLARDAAHNVERPAAPLTTYLLGYAAGQRDAGPEELERLAAAAATLATKWGLAGGDTDGPAAAQDAAADVEDDVEDLGDELVDVD